MGGVHMYIDGNTNGCIRVRCTEDRLNFACNIEASRHFAFSERIKHYCSLPPIASFAPGKRHAIYVYV